MSDHYLASPEGMLVCAVLTDPSCYDEVRWLDPDIFGNEWVRQLYVAVQYVLARSPNLDREQLASRVKDLLVEYKRHDAVSLLVQAIGSNTGSPAAVDYYARKIFERRQDEDMRSGAARIMQVANSEADVPHKRQMIQEAYESLIEVIESEPGWRPVQGLEPVNEFMAATDETYDWVIPGLLERQERFMCIAPEKAGKTTLTRQVLIALAVGRHPLNVRYPITPMRSLLVDLENPAPVARREFRRQVQQMDDLWAYDNDVAYVLHRPAGINLGDVRDRLMLRQAMELARPDLLCVSPIYKAYDGLQQGWEEQAHGVQKPLDMLREQFDCAIWMEHHPPGRESGRAHREIRPFGSTRWGRWLDYQAALVPTQESPNPPYRELWWNSVQRDQRKMAPRMLRRGIATEPSWVPVWNDGDQYGFGLALDASLNE